MNKQEEIVATQQQMPSPTNMPIYAFLVGSAISYTGDILTLLAIPWFVLQTTGSIVQTGITAFFSALPAAISAFFGSTIIDRLGYKRTSVIGDIASGIAVLLIPLLYATLGLAFWQLLTLVFIGGLLKSPGSTARASMIPDLAELGSMRLERINAFSDGANRLSGLLGAPLAGILIASIGTSNLLWFDALSFFISALLIGISAPPTPPVYAEKEDTKHPLTKLLMGMRFMYRDALIFSIVITVMITNLLDGALFSVIAPAYIKQVFHSALALGLIVAAIGGASFAGTIIFSVIGHRLPRRWTFGIGFTIGGAFRFFIFLIPVLPLIIVWHIIAGLCIAPLNPLIDTILQERLPAEMRARVFGAVSAGVLIGIPLGTLAGGFVASWLGLSVTLAVMGVLYLLTTLSLLVNPALKQMERQKPI